MIRLVRQVGEGLATILAVGVLTFLLVHAAPGDPAISLLGGKQGDPELLQQIREQHHLDQPLGTQLVLFLKDLITLDLGKSIRTGQDVTAMIASQIGITVQLVVGSVLVIYVISIPLGVLAGAYRDTWIDKLLSSFSLFWGSIPVFFSAILFIQLLSTKLQLLPSFGTGEAGWDRVLHLLLPVLVLGLQVGASVTKIVRTAVVEAMQEDYIRLAIAKGISHRRVIWVHAFRASWLSAFTVTSLDIGILMVQAVLVEYTFGLGGFGSLMVNAAQQSDYPVVQGCAIVSAAIFVVINAIADRIYPKIDPRIHTQEQAAA